MRRRRPFLAAFLVVALAPFTLGEHALGSGKSDDEKRRDERPPASHGRRRATSRAK